LIKLTEELLKKACTSRIVVSAYRDGDRIHTKQWFNWAEDEEIQTQEYDLIMKMINVGGRFDEYLKYFYNELSFYPLKQDEMIEFDIDIGAVIFLEYVLKDSDGDAYKCEPTQFVMMLDPSYDSVKTVTRRGTKSFTDRVPTFRDVVCYPGFHAQVTMQSMTVARMWLDDIYTWIYNNELIKSWSGGLPLLRDGDKYLKLRNRSYILVHTASSLENLSGIGVHKQIYDEESLYTHNTSRSRVTARGQVKKKGRSKIKFRRSGTPFGSGTVFHTHQIDPEKWQYYAPMLCPINSEKPVCYNCDHFTLTKYRRKEIPNLQSLECTAPLPIGEDGIPVWSETFKRIPDNRFTFKELEEDWKELGKDLFMQEYMCATMDYSGNAIPLDLIHQIMDDELEQIFASDWDCYVGVDFGLSEHHRSAITVIGINPKTGKLQVLNVIVLPAGTPLRTRDPTSGDHRTGVVETVLQLFKAYPNIQCIVADAMGIGLEFVEKDMVDLCVKMHNFSNVVPFKTTGESKSKLWLGTVKPALGLGKVTSYMDRNLYLQMRAWRMEFDATKDTKPKLHAPSAGAIKSDDALMSFLYALHGALAMEIENARTSVPVAGIDPSDYLGPTVFEREW